MPKGIKIDKKEEKRTKNQQEKTQLLVIEKIYSFPKAIFPLQKRYNYFVD